MTFDAHPALVAERDARLAALGSLPPWWRPIARRRWRMQRAAILATDVSWSTMMLRSVYTGEAVLEAMQRPKSLYAMLRKDPDSE